MDSDQCICSGILSPCTDGVIDDICTIPDQGSIVLNKGYGGIYTAHPGGYITYLNGNNYLIMHGIYTITSEPYTGAAHQVYNCVEALNPDSFIDHIPSSPTGL